MDIVFKNATDLQKEFLMLHLEVHYRKNINIRLSALIKKNLEEGYSEDNIKKAVIVVVAENQPYTNVLCIDRVTLKTYNQDFTLEEDVLIDVKISLMYLSSIKENLLGARLVNEQEDKLKNVITNTYYEPE